jgi:uncharacterized protein YndB with AHSA1/START domain
VSDSKVSSKAAPFEFVIKRTFNAPLERIWKAWTDSKQLLQWWGPKGFTTVSAKISELKPGGMFHYCLRSPQGQEMWGRFVYREIVPNKRLVYINSFSDPEGGIGRHPLAPNWPLQLLSTITFAEKDGKPPSQFGGYLTRRPRKSARPSRRAKPRCRQAGPGRSTSSKPTSTTLELVSF